MGDLNDSPLANASRCILHYTFAHVTIYVYTNAPYINLYTAKTAIILRLINKHDNKKNR